MTTPIEVPTLKKKATPAQKPWDREARRAEEEKKRPGFEFHLKKAAKADNDRATPPKQQVDLPALKKVEQQQRPKVEAAKLEAVALKETEKPKSAFDEVSKGQRSIRRNLNFLKRPSFSLNTHFLHFGDKICII